MLVRQLLVDEQVRGQTHGDQQARAQGCERDQESEAAAAAAAIGSKAAAAGTSKAAAVGISKATPAAKPKKLKVIAVEALKAIPAAKPKARTNIKRARDEVDDDDVPQEDARPAKARKTAAVSVWLLSSSARPLNDLRAFRPPPVV